MFKILQDAINSPAAASAAQFAITFAKSARNGLITYCVLTAIFGSFAGKRQ